MFSLRMRVRRDLQYKYSGRNDASYENRWQDGKAL